MLVVENRVSSISSLKVNVSATQQIFIVNFWDYEFKRLLLLQKIYLTFKALDLDVEMLVEKYIPLYWS